MSKLKFIKNIKITQSFNIDIYVAKNKYII